MRVNVLLFAAARASAGSASCEVELAEPASVADLKAALAKSCPALASILGASRIAIDRAYAINSDLIPAGAELAIIPPVSGGSDESRWTLSISPDPIDHASVVDSVRSDQAGAVCSFLGTVREMTGDKQTTHLDYESYPGMAEQSLRDLAVQALARWPIERLAIVHRVGTLGLGEISVVVAVSTPHRGDSFDACRWLIDTLKQVVPIWKKETWTDGTEEWMHPGLS